MHMLLHFRCKWLQFFDDLGRVHAPLLRKPYHFDRSLCCVAGVGCRMCLASEGSNRYRQLVAYSLEVQHVAHTKTVST